MPVPSTIADLSQTAASNSPLGTDTVGPNLDDYLRAFAAFIRQQFDGTSFMLTGVAGSDTVTASCAVPFAAYVTGQTFRFVAAEPNTGATTLNINGLGTKNVTKYGTTALDGGDIQPGAVTEVVYDGTQFQLISAPYPVATYGGSRNKLINATGNINYRGYVSGTATVVANQYTLVMWRVVTSGQNLTFSTSGNYKIFTAPAGGIEQVVEGVNIEGGVYVLNWAGTATATVNGTAVTKGQKFTLTANTNAIVRFIGGTFILPQLEANRVTPFEWVSYEGDESRANRYCQIIRFDATGYQNASQGITHFINFRMMRVAPSVAVTSSPTYAGITAPPALSFVPYGVVVSMVKDGSNGTYVVANYTMLLSAEI